jgi:hypothetical protein
VFWSPVLPGVRLKRVPHGQSMRSQGRGFQEKCHSLGRQHASLEKQHGEGPEGASMELADPSRLSQSMRGVEFSQWQYGGEECLVSRLLGWRIKEGEHSGRIYTFLVWATRWMVMSKWEERVCEDR